MISIEIESKVSFAIQMLDNMVYNLKYSKKLDKNTIISGLENIKNVLK